MKKNPINKTSEPKKNDDRSNAIAIVGMSGRYPEGADTPELLWKTLVDGVDAVTEAKGDRWDLGWHNSDHNKQWRVYTKAGGYLTQIDGFDAEFFGMSAREAQQVDPQQRLLLELAWEALEDSGIAPRSLAGSDIGVFVGISSNDYSALLGETPPNAYSNTGSSFSIAANRISYVYDFHGPSVALDTACSSSIVCIHQACRSILNGECSGALAGGVSLLTHIRPWIGFARASMLSPTGRCKSFDASGDGYVRSEGGGLVMLKSLESAERDGDRILGVILASGVNSDGRTMGLSMPNDIAQENLLRKIYTSIGVAAEDVVYVEAHGTGTAVGDPLECGSIGRVLGAPRADGSKLLIGSVKSNIGHLEAASGIAGLTKVLLALKHREIPGNLHFDTPNPKIDFEGWNLDVVNKNTPLPQTKDPAIVGINSFGFGGTNAHIALQEYRPEISDLAAREIKPWSNVLFLSGGSEAALLAVAQRYADYLRTASPENWSDICAAAAVCRTQLRYRLVVAGSTPAEAADRLELFIAGKQTSRTATGNVTAENIPIAFVYSGNGPQWWGMGRELLESNQDFKAEVEAVDAVFAPLSGWSIIEEMAKPETETRVALTEFAQPLLFALQLGITRLLRQAEVHPSAVLGHSVGEVAAAYASGALDLAQATRVIYHRSMAQSKTAGQGKMAALGISAVEAIAAIETTEGWLELAASNAPNAVTVAGDADALEALRQTIADQGKFARVLPLNYAFHSTAMDPIRDGLVESLAGLQPGDSKVPFISTVDAAEISGPTLDAEYWWRNIREQVKFHEAIDLLLKERGFAVFLEIGPHPVLKDYVQQSARARDISIASLQTLRRPGNKGPEPEEDNLWTAICACHAAGVSNVAGLFDRPRTNIPELPLYPWQRERHWRGGVVLPESYHPIKRDHPLLGYRVPSADGIWEVILNTETLTYLADHVVQGSVVFPAAGYIEQALTAAGLTLGSGTLDVENFEILRPLVIPEHDEPTVQFSVDLKDGTFEIRSLLNKYESNWTVNSKGRLSISEGAIQPSQLDISALSSILPINIASEVHYRDTDNRGLCYGPQFQGVKCLSVSETDADIREAFAEISLPELIDSGLIDYRSHPSLLDSCLQVLVGLIGQKEGPTVSAIPVHVERIRSFGALPSRIFCHVTMQRESVRSAIADFQISDSEGNVLLVLEGARCQKVDFKQSAPAPLITDWWRPDPVYGLSSIDFPAVQGDITESLKHVIDHISTKFDRDTYYDVVLPRFNRLAASYAARTLNELWPDDTEFNLARLARKGKVTRDQQALLERLVTIAEQDCLLTKTEKGWVWDRSQRIESSETVWRALFYDFPQYQTELLLISRAGDRLTDVLRGEAEPLISCEADHSGGAADVLTDTAPFQAPYNAFVRSLLLKLVESWPVGRPIRILEIGGNYGGLTSAILPILPPDRTDYLFTDPSEAAIGRAEQRFRGCRFTRFAQVDIEKNPAEQGLLTGYYDIVIAPNTLHRTGSLQKALGAVRTVLAKGGQLIALETHDHRFTDLVFGQDPTWWEGTELVSSIGSRLAGTEDWTRILTESGFEQPAILSDHFLTAQQSVIVARNGRSTDEVNSSANPKSSRFLLLTGKEEAESIFVRSLTEALSASGSTVRQLSLDEDSDLAATLKSIASESPIDEIVQLTGISTSQINGDCLLSQQSLRCLSTLTLVQALEAAQLARSPSLTLVTNGALATLTGEGPLDPGQAPLWGLGRVISSEVPGLNCRLIDLHHSLGDPDAVYSLAAELGRRDDENEVQIHQGLRYVNRERLTSLTEETRSGLTPSTEVLPFVLDFHSQGGLDSLFLRSMERTAPAKGQVEIKVKAAGLNFRDVLWAMGMLPEEAVEHGFSGATIGMECAGEIVAVGPDVTAFKPGDRVIAFASSCFASHVTTSIGSVALIPDGIGYEQAATIPTAFLTAYYALEHLARIAPGEKVLIHGAAGGVGLAAVQIAKLRGAVVFGTAGSVGKRRALSMLGVDHVLNSRSLDFADEVIRLTDGVGVDIVLNSLAGEAITKSLQVLRPFGRFLEIGKRDLYANSRIGLRPFRNNLSYFGIDADTLLIERPDLARTNFQAVVDLFASGELRPLPYQAIPVSRAAEAFRAMQQSKHIGKLVVTMEDDLAWTLPIVKSETPIKPDATYLVTGGLGGFGLSTAKWLVAQGATSLALIGRRGATTDEAIAGIAELEGAGAVVRAFAADISDADALNEVISTIRNEMAPLRGVIHSAAVIEDSLIINLKSETLDRVLAPKALGAWNVHNATLSDDLDLFVLYSSSSVVIGNPGQGAYVAANMYLESLAQYRRKRGLPAFAIGWGAIKDAGFLTRHTNVADMLKSRSGLDATPVSEALPELGRLSAVGATRVCVARFNLQKLGQALSGSKIPRFLSILPKGSELIQQGENTFADSIKSAPAADRRDMVLARLKEHAGRVLGGGANQIEVDRPLAEMGLDSLMAVELAAAIERDLGQPVSVMQMLSAGKLSGIADLVLRIVGIGEESPS